MLSILVHPDSPRDDIVPAKNGTYDVYTTESKDRGRANTKMVKILANYLHTSPTKLIVASGEQWNEKTVLFEG